MSLQNLIQTQGWKEVEKMFEEAILRCKSEEVSEELDGDNYKTVALANLKAAEKMQKLLDSIKTTGVDNKKEVIKYT